MKIRAADNNRQRIKAADLMVKSKRNWRLKLRVVWCSIIETVYCFLRYRTAFRLISFATHEILFSENKVRHCIYFFRMPYCYFSNYVHLNFKIRYAICLNILYRFVQCRGHICVNFYRWKDRASSLAKYFNYESNHV